MTNLRKAIQIALYGTVLVGAGSVSAAVDVLQNGGAEWPGPGPSECSQSPDYWNTIDGNEGGVRVPYGTVDSCMLTTPKPGWVQSLWNGEDWMFYTGPRNSGGGSMSSLYQTISIPEEIQPAPGGLCIDSMYPPLDQGFWVEGWFSTKCYDGVEGAAGIHCKTGGNNNPEDYGRVRVTANGNSRCTSAHLQSEREDGQPATWEQLAPDACADGLEGGPGAKTYRLTLEGHDLPDAGIRPDVVWDNMALHIQCTGAVASVGGRSYDTPSKPNGKQKPVRTYGGMGWAEWAGGWDGAAEGFAVKAKFTVTYHKTPGGDPLRDTCHLEADENTAVQVQNTGPWSQSASFAGLAMWCNQSGCEDEDVNLRLLETPAPGRVELSGVEIGGGCTAGHNFGSNLDAGNVMVEGVAGPHFGMDTD